MALKRFHVPAEPTNPIHFGSISWKAAYDGKKLVFTNSNMSKGGKVVLNDVNPGDYVGFSADGPASRAFKVKSPKDEKITILWRYGFTKPKRVISDTYWEQDKEGFPGFHQLLERKHGPNSLDRNQYGQLVLDWDVRYVTIRNDAGEIMVETGRGRLHCSNNIFDHWYLSPKATIADVKAWEAEYLKKVGE